MIRQDTQIVRILTPVALLSLLTLFQFTYQPANYLVLGLLFLISLRSKYWRIMTILLVMMVKYTHDPQEEPVMRYDLATWLIFASYFLLSLKGIVRIIMEKDLVLKMLALFLGVTLILSLFSQIPQMSLLKLAGFTMGIATCYVLARESEHPIHDLLFGVLIFYAITGTISFSYPEVSVMEWSTLHKGITKHAQYYATLLSPLVALAVISYLRRPRIDWRALLLLALMFLGMGQLFYTYSRTGMLSSFLGVLITLFFMLYRERARSVLLKILLMVSLLLVPALVKFDELSNMVALILTKEIKQEDALMYSPSPFGLEDVVATRQELVDMSYANFLEHPATGIGFGIPSELAFFDMRSDDLFEIPLSAPIEKGNILSTVLEENGLIGFLFFAAFLFVLLKRGFAGSYADIALMTSAFLVNMGEMAFFATNGPGPYIWLLMFAGFNAPTVKEVDHAGT